MATIKVKDIALTGYNLFDDTESYLSDLNDSESGSIQGGLFIPPCFPRPTIFTPPGPIFTFTRPVITRF